jgi:hypothetical protein
MAGEEDAASAARRRRAQRAFGACGVAALGAFVLVLIASVHKTPGVHGVLSGTLAGLLAALVIGVCGAWIAMSIVAPQLTPPSDTQTADDLAGTLGPVFAELEAARAEVVRQVNARALTRVPLGAICGGAIWFLEQLSGKPDRDGFAGVVFSALCLIGVGAMAGYFAAAHARSDAYARLYFRRVLPLLAARFGDLSFRSPAQLDLRTLIAEKLFDEFDTAVSDIEFFGTRRGLPISIVSLKLTSGSGKEKRSCFEGLLVEVALPRSLHATTAVIAHTGAFGQFRDWLSKSDRRRVELEDPRFAASYDAWGTDQIAARALLTPAFIERLLALSGPGSNIDGRPLVLARDNRLTLAIPRAGRDHFIAPGIREPAAGRASLTALNDHIAAVLAVADTVIGLDQAARAVAAASLSRSPPHA